LPIERSVDSAAARTDFKLRSAKFFTKECADEVRRKQINIDTG
jgi:hypothetical protein